MGESAAIGIDLGTTYSCVAVFRDGEPKVLDNVMGHKVTPSYVTIKSKQDSDDSDEEDDLYVGQTSKDEAFEDPERALFDIKRLIGRKFDDPFVQEDLKLWPFQVIHEDSTPKIKVDGTTYLPQEISAQLLRYLKKTAEEKLGRPVTKAVITVPAYFKRNQRKATKEAGELAGLEVLRIINEPTAAAIAYNSQTQREGKRNWLVFDLGGGTFDVAILTTEGNKIEMKGIDGHSHLGGEDFDNIMVNYCIEQFNKLHNIDLNEHRNSVNVTEKKKAIRALRRLKVECQNQKEYLSSAPKVKVTMDVFYNGLGLAVEFDQQLFNKLNDNYFQLCMKIVDKAIKKSRLRKEEIHDVVLVGGSSRIPKILKMLADMFGEDKLRIDISADEAVALGAAICAHQLDILAGGNQDENQNQVDDGRMREMSVSDVVLLPISIEIKGVNVNDEPEYTDVIPKYSKIPCSNSIQILVDVLDDGSVSLNVYEGHRSKEDCQFLGSLEFKGFDLKRGGKEAIDLMMMLDADGILQASASLIDHPDIPKVFLTEDICRKDDVLPELPINSNLEHPINVDISYEDEIDKGSSKEEEDVENSPPSPSLSQRRESAASLDHFETLQLNPSPLRRSDRQSVKKMMQGKAQQLQTQKNLKPTPTFSSQPNLPNIKLAGESPFPSPQSSTGTGRFIPSRPYEDIHEVLPSTFPIQPRPIISSPIPSTPITLCINLDEKSISVGCFNFRNSRKFELLIPEMDAGLIFHKDKILLMDEAGPDFLNSHPQSRSFTLWDLLIDPPTKSHRILQNFTLKHKELIAIIFIKIRLRIEQSRQAKISNVVLALSFMSTADQRERLEDSAKLAGINDIRLTSSSLATAITDTKAFGKLFSKFVCIVQYTTTYLNMTIVAVRPTSATVEVVYGTEWMKPSTSFLKHHATLVEGGTLEKKDEGTVEKVYKQIWNKCKTYAQNPEPEEFMVVSRSPTGVDAFLAKLWQKPFVGVDYPNAVLEGGANLASILDNYDAFDRSVSHLELTRPSRALGSTSRVDEPLERMMKRRIFSKSFKLSKSENSHVTIDLKEVFSNGKVHPVCSYQVMAKASALLKKFDTAIVTCDVNENGVYSVSFEAESSGISLDVLRNDRPRLYRKRPYRFNNFLELTKLDG